MKNIKLLINYVLPIYASILRKVFFLESRACDEAFDKSVFEVLLYKNYMYILYLIQKPHLDSQFESRDKVISG